METVSVSSGMPIKCIAIDDEPLALNLLQEYAGRFPALQLVQVFDDAIAGAAWLRNHPVDLLFIDINMPDISGLDLVRSLPARPMVIFTTAYKKFAAEGFDLDAIDYLVKPIPFERFERAVMKAIDYSRYRSQPQPSKGEAIFVRSEYQLVKINLDDIEYVESLEDYVKIHRVSDKPVMSLMTLKALLEKLPPEGFQRIHRSYVVSLARVRSLVNRKVRVGNVELPVSSSYVEALNKWIKK